VGTGTGRISVPLLERGADLIGCDISSNMLARLKDKFPSARIAKADASLLPLPEAHFDVVLTVHVMHLIPPWRAALREFRRVLKPRGKYLNVRTWAPGGASIRDELRHHWRQWVEAQGVDVRHVGIQDLSELLQELKVLDGSMSEIEVMRYTLPFTLREELERFGARSSSETWDVPDVTFDASMSDLRAWVDQHFGDLDQQLEEEVRFVIDVVQF
ncbi:MAG TPA: class I SAM-dependent methyltransferase, partial [Anaerolineales bacterium]|nr:class I SAM-dependent methyltransferase [Anaerolineales bacterium]